MGRRKLTNSHNKVISVRITDEKFEQLKSFSPELKDKFNKQLKQTANDLIDRLIKIKEEEEAVKFWFSHFNRNSGKPE